MALVFEYTSKFFNWFVALLRYKRFNILNSVPFVKILWQFSNRMWETVSQQNGRILRDNPANAFALVKIQLQKFYLEAIEMVIPVLKEKAGLNDVKR